MHIKRVEEYSFEHGMHRDNPTGKFYPLQPHIFGRPLTHEEMDYNMRYMEQTLGGYKIFGSNDDTTLSDADVDKSLVLHRITPADADYARYTAGGYFTNGELIWIPDCCGTGSGGESGQVCNIGITALQSAQATQGQQDSSIIVLVTGSQGSPIFTINGVSVTANSITGNQYTFNGYGAGTYTVVAIDSGVTDYVCDDSATVSITETVDICSTFSLSLQAQSSGSDEDPALCNLEPVGILVSSTQQVGFGEEDGSAVIEIDGTWTGPLTWSVRKDGVVTSIVPQLVAGNQFSLSGLGGGTWLIYAIDAGVPGGNCYQSWTFTIAEEENACDTFTVSLAVQNSGSETDPDPCLTFDVELVTADSGGDNHTNTVCQDFAIQLSVVQESLGGTNGELLLSVANGSWGSLNIDYTTSDPFDPSTVWTSVDTVSDNGDGTYNLRPFGAGMVSIRVIEDNNLCFDIETINVP